jgi:type VI secretion system protein ImpL
LTNPTAAHGAARQVAQAFSPDPDAHVDATTLRLMEDPITNVEALLRTLGPKELNGKGATLCAIYRPVLNKFPFNPSATLQATIADVNGIFHKPDGALWKFYDENLQKLLPKQGSQYVAATVDGVTLTPSFVTFFNNAVAFADFAYGGGTPDPHFTYTLKPVPIEGIQSASLQFDGQSLSYSNSDAAPAPKQFVWQATGAHEAKVTLNSATVLINYDGLWAIFYAFNNAETWHNSGNNNILDWFSRSGKDQHLQTYPNGKPIQFSLELDMGGGPQVFQKNYFARMACVAEVAR